MAERSIRFLAVCATFVALLGATAGAQVTVYNNFGEEHDGWNYDYTLGWSVAGKELTFPAQFGIEQAMGFKSTASGTVCDIWLPIWYVPEDDGYDEVTIRLVRNPDGLPPSLEHVMESWVLTDFEAWNYWSPPIHLVGSGASYLEAREDYWIWATGGETTWCGWCMVENGLACLHTHRIEGEDWTEVTHALAAAFRVDVMPDPEPCAGDLDGDGDTDLSDLSALLADWGCDGGGNDCPGDLDGDHDTDLSDLSILLADWDCVQ
jgi:hypothetical protein